MNPQARNIYIGVMCVAGMALAAVTLKWPEALSGYATAFGAMLVASFLVDMALMRLSGGDEVMPLSIEARFGGFFAGMILYLAITGLFGAPAA